MPQNISKERFETDPQHEQRRLDHLDQAYCLGGYPRMSNSAPVTGNNLRPYKFNRPIGTPNFSQRKSANETKRKPPSNSRSESDIKTDLSAKKVEVLNFYVKNREFFVFPFLFPSEFKSKMIEQSPEFKSLQLKFSQLMSSIPQRGLAIEVYKPEGVLKTHSKIAFETEAYKKAMIGVDRGDLQTRLGGLAGVIDNQQSLQTSLFDLTKFVDEHPALLMFIHANMSTLEAFAIEFRSVYNDCINHYQSDPEQLKKREQKRNEERENRALRLDALIEQKKQQKLAEIDAYIKDMLSRIPNYEQLNLEEELSSMVDSNELNENNYRSVCRRLLENYNFVFSNPIRKNRTPELASQVNILSLVHEIPSELQQKLLRDTEFRNYFIEQIILKTKKVGLANENFIKIIKDYATDLVLASRLNNDDSTIKKPKALLLKASQPTSATTFFQDKKPLKSEKPLLLTGTESSAIIEEEKTKKKSRFGLGGLFKLVKTVERKVKKEKKDKDKKTKFKSISKK